MINREKLYEIKQIYGKESWWKPELFIQNILPVLPSELEILSNPPQEEENYNCFAYAFGFGENEKIIKDCGGFIYDTFYLKLLELGEIKKISNPKDGDYIIYEDDVNYPDFVHHMGVVDGDSVISKWSWGPLVRHGIFDVPASYGNDISYLEQIDKSRLEMLYWKYKDFNIKCIIAD